MSPFFSGINIIDIFSGGWNKGGGIGGLLNLKEGTNNYSYLYDGKGNVMVVLNSSQSIVASYRYDVYGNLLKTAGTFDQPFRFSTKRYDAKTGHYYYGYRFYNPMTGTWITRDPLGEAGGINLYGFNNNNAINYIDSWGLAYFAKRPLRPSGVTLPFMINSQTDNILNTEISHEHIFFEDEMGGNVGFGEHGRFSETKPEIIKQYVKTSEYFEDSVLREAIKKVDDGAYCFLGLFCQPKNNCQDWADKVRSGYNILMNNRRIQ